MLETPDLNIFGERGFHFQFTTKERDVSKELSSDEQLQHLL